MSLPAFRIHRASTVEEATQMLDEFGDEAVVHCGGTELVLVMKLGLAPYSHLIDIKPIAELSGVRVGEDLWIGSTTTHQQIESHPEILRRWAGIAEMTSTVGNIRVRSVGTLGGNLCFADPHSDPIIAMLAVGGVAECRRGAEPVRQVPMEEFLLGPYETVVRPGELLLGVRIAAPTAGTVHLHRKIRFHEYAVAAVSMTYRVQDNRFADLRLAVGAVGPQAALVAETATLLADVPVDTIGANQILDDLAEATIVAGRPVTDNSATEEYKTHLLRVLVHRTFAEASTTLTSPHKGTS